jgi:hypothetical protein
MLAESHESVPEGERMSTRRTGSRTFGLLAAATLVTLAFLLGAPSAARADVRTISTVTGDYYFDGNYFLEADEVLLVRVLPILTLEAKYTLTVSPNLIDNLFYVGPVVNFSDTLYGILIGGLGFDNTAQHNLIYEVDGGFNWETDVSTAFVNMKWTQFSADGSWYVLPSIGGKAHIVPALGMFGEFFFSYDSAGNSTGAFWGEADYQLGSVVDLLAGFTLTFSLGNLANPNSSKGLGYSIIAGATITFTQNLDLKYKFSYLSNVVQYQGMAPAASTGIENLLSLDWKL